MLICHSQSSFCLTPCYEYLQMKEYHQFFLWRCQNLPPGLRTAHCFNLTITLYKVGALLTVWNSTTVKLKVISSRKTSVLVYDYRVWQSFINRTDSIKDLGVFTDAKLHFHDHVNYLFSHCINLLGLVHSINCNFSSLERMLTLYIALVRSKLEYASVVWNSITQTRWNASSRGLRPTDLIVPASLFKHYAMKAYEGVDV
jgi:hypothetical protein